MVDLERVSGLRPGDWEWQQHAACRGMGAATFFHPQDERDPARSERIAAAKAVCEPCPALNDCRAYALRFREPYGIWGGLSESERASLLGVRSMRYPGTPAASRRVIVRRSTVTARHRGNPSLRQAR